MDITNLKRKIGPPSIQDVIEHGPRNWSAFIKSGLSRSRVRYERVHKKDLDETAQADALRFSRWNPNSICIQIRERTEGETMMVSEVRMPNKQFLALAVNFIESLPELK